MPNSEQREVIERYIDAYNRMDVEGMLGLLTADVLFENVADGKVTASSSGIAEFRQLAEQSKTMFSERNQRIESMTFRPASVVVGIAWRGVLAVDVPGGPAAGTAMEMAGESEFEFAGARISRIVDRS